MTMDMEMDLGVVSVTRTRTPDSDTETPPRNPPTKRVHHTHAPYVSYKECMKNHAASIGGHALDGCCEFMPGPTFNLMDPTSLKCGACGCHRNFHRRDPDDPTPLNHSLIPARGAHSPPSASQLLLSLSHSPSGPSDEVNPTAGGVLVGYVSPGGQNGNFNSGKKRFRTKFTQEQKEKMHEFSEKIGWKLRKGEERLVEDFVKDIGVGRNVFKVWMHNNKHNNHNNHNNHNSSSNNNNNNIVADSINRDNVVNYEQQQHSSSNGSKSTSTNITTSNVAAGNCGASVFDNHNHNRNHNHVHNLNLNHHRQFNFANGGGQEAAQAQ